MHLDHATRRVAVRRAVTLGGAALVGGTYAAVRGDEATSAPSTATDRETYAYLLELEQLQLSFYEAGLKAGKLDGPAAEYARAVVAQEREHVALLRRAAGSKAGDSADYDFSAATGSQDAFVKNARKLEDLGVGAYLGALTRVTAGARPKVVRIMSVEARHASWVRDIGGGNPAPNATDAPRAEAEVRAAVKQTGFVR